MSTQTWESPGPPPRDRGHVPGNTPEEGDHDFFPASQVYDAAPTSGDVDLDFESAVHAAMRRKAIAKEADARLRAAGLPPAEPFDAGTLSEMLARPAPPPARVEGLIPADASTLIVAMRKTGKTTFMLNLARCLLRGEYFLGRFATRPVSGAIAILNYEVSGHTLAAWAHEHGIPEDRLVLVNLRGRRNPLADEQDRSRLAAYLREHAVEALIVDPFGRAYTGTSQNDSGEVAAWLASLDTFARSEVGATDLVLAAHAGWEGERTRGASALEDWADSIITITRGKGPDESKRFLKAIGRDVEVEEDRLDFEPERRRLSLTGEGGRSVSAAANRDEDLMPKVLAAIAAEPGITGKRLEEAIGGRKGAPQRLAQSASRWVSVGSGERSAKVYTLTPEGLERLQELTYPHVPPTYPRGTLDDVPPPPPKGGGCVRGRSGDVTYPRGDVESDRDSNSAQTDDVIDAEVIEDTTPPKADTGPRCACGDPIGELRATVFDTCVPCHDRANGIERHTS